MPPYDSDSSGDEASDYTETNVLLGYASKDPTDDTFSQLGGHPTWLDAAHPPSFTLTKCPTCAAPMPLLLQLNGDLPQHFPGHSRRLYIFACRRKTCARAPTGAARALRAVKSDAALAAAERRKNEADAARRAADAAADAERRRQQGALGSALFGGPTPAEARSANPFAANPFAAAAAAPANPFASPPAGLAAVPAQAPGAAKAAEELPATFAQKARIAGEKEEEKEKAAGAAKQPFEAWPADAAALARPYPRYHLDADYEALGPEDDAIPANARLDPDAAEPAEEPAGKSGGGKEDKETFESLMDKTFQRFADRLAQNPEQVLRYEWRGEPLLYSRTDAVGKMLATEDEDEDEEQGGKVKTVGGRKGIPRCGNCGGERVFEMQLTPQAIAELEAEELGLDGMEWGAVIVGVCGKDCVAKDVKDGEVGYLEEWVGVQWEEVTERRK
ncbi:hypothetical protein GTA08_BOTSDO06410 [Neofusicoccum parvum]|nr:hypothetical protein GTA08_BOTSDO06410 [Neofusicoccum parvum]